MREQDATFGAYIHLHFLVFIWGFTAVLGRLITVGSVEIVFYRTLIAVIGLYLLMKFRKISLEVPQRDFWIIMGTGSVIALHWTTFFLAAEISNIAICLTGLATTTFWTSLIDPIFNGRKIKLYEPMLGLVSIAGIAVAFSAAMDSWMGLLMGVLSAIFAATFTVINGHLIKRQNHYKITFYEITGAFLTMVILMVGMVYLFRQEIQFKINALDGLYLLILALVCTVYAFSAGVKIMHKLTPFAVNLTINLEPVYGIIIAFLLFKEEEQMPPNFYIGSFLIMLAVISYPLIQKLMGEKGIEKEMIN